LLVDAVGEQKTLEIVDSQMLSSWKIALVEMENLIRLGNTASISLRTSSMGRLYDGIAALVCGVGHVSFEGEAAMRLEATCNSEVRDAYRLYIGNETPFEIDWRPMVRELVADLALGVPVGTIAMKFHRAIAECIATVGFRYPELPIVLAGGVFQNRVLVELVEKQLRDRERSYTMSCKIPPNDGGLAIGQLAIASARIERALCV
jgi:hydrogenase maturation protein HypF